jgi:hypothetical protein
VNAVGHVVETTTNIHSQLSEGRFQLLRKPIVMAVFD